MREWSLADVRAVFEFKRHGLTDREISQKTGIAVNTIRAWRNRRVPSYARPGICHERRVRDDTPPDVSTLPAHAYTYVLGVYLGDGCLARNGTSWTLRIALDQAYPGIIAEREEAIRRVAQGRRVYTRPVSGGQRCMTVSCTWYPWAFQFPQHGPGRKHNRRIELASWQRKLVHLAPHALLRGLIHTDGWHGLNRVYVKGRHYAYPRYQFSNRSDDIRKLFTDVCDRLGVECRQWTRYHISVARRESVAYLDRFIGPKY